MVDRAGLLFGLVAYVWWGLVPFYFDWVSVVPAADLLAHRIIWSGVLLAGVLTWMKRWGDVRSCLRSPKTRLYLLATTLLIALNWRVYIHSVVTKQVIEASLGYFILPLVSILLGLLFLQERLNNLQWAAVILAAMGVALFVHHLGRLPWIALTLAGSFSLYGFLRKKMAIDGMVSLSIETLLLAPFAAGYLLVRAAQGEASMTLDDLGLDALLLFSGVVTTVPLYCFGEAARRLPLTVLGFMQFLSPIIALLVAVVRLGESFGPEKQRSFAFIWTALVLFTWSMFRRAEPREFSQRR
jgi:chloramphenicol-sensitive protein RarD